MSLLRDIQDVQPRPVTVDVIQPRPGLIRELAVFNAPQNVQADLKKSDKTDAGSRDVASKARQSDDVSFSLMRNTINNTKGAVTGSDVADYIERAEELNDEVDTIPFGLETDDGQIVKVYVNAEQADQFEDAMKNMLGLEDDIEEAINRLTTEFDIVDVVWPRPEGDDAGGVDDEELEIDDTSALDPEDDLDFADGNYDDVSAASEEDSDGNASPEEIEQKRKTGTTDDEIKAAANADKAAAEKSGGSGAAKKSDETEGEEDTAAAEVDGDAAPEDGGSSEDSEEEETSGEAGGEPKKKKKKKKAQPAEPVEDEEETPKNEALSNKMTNQENPMSTFGDKFLNRILEAQEDTDGVRDGFNIPLDSQARALAAKLKLPLAKRLVAFHVMAGIPGRYLNTEEGENGIGGAADMLRKKVSVRRAFLAFYEALAKTKGLTIPPDTQTEGKVMEAKGEYNSYAAWRKAARAADSSVWFDGDKDIANAMIGEKPYKRGKTKSIGEWDGAVGWVKAAKLKEEKLDEAPKQKRGSFIQRLFETVEIELGVPATLVTTSGPAAVSTALYKTAELIEQNSELERSLRVLALRLGIKQSDAMSAVEESKKVDEAVDVGNDDFAQAITQLVSSLGIPDDVLQRRRTQIVQALRQKKQSLRNRSQVLTMIGRLQTVLDNNTQAPAGQQQARGTQGTQGAED